MTANRREGEDRILTVPNVLTAIRLMCLPVFVALMAEPHRRGELAAACLLSGLGVTDGLDGYIARHFHQVSSLGKVADPLVDRALVLTAVISALVIGAIPVWLVALVLTREFLVLAGGGALALAGVRRVDVSWAGKAGTFGMMFALPLFIAGHAPFRWQTEAEIAAWVAAGWGLALGWYAAWGYIPRARAALAEGREARLLLGPSKASPAEDLPTPTPKRSKTQEDEGFERASSPSAVPKRS